MPAPNDISCEKVLGASFDVCNVAGRDLASVAKEIEAKVKSEVHFDLGYHPEFLGEGLRALQQSQGAAALLSLLSLGGIVLIIYLDVQVDPLYGRWSS